MRPSLTARSGASWPDRSRPGARRQRSPGACVGAGISKTEAGAGYREDEQHFPRRVVAVADQGLGQRGGASVSRVVIAKGRARQYIALRYSSGAPVSKTGRRARGILALPGTEPVNLVSSSSGRDGHPVDQTAAAWALRTGDRARHEIEATHRALGRSGRPGPLRQGKEDRGTRAPRSRSSTDGDGRLHPGMDEALIAVDSRRKRCGRDRAAGGNQRRGEGPAGEPRALRHRGQPQQVVEGLDAAAAEGGDLGEGVVLAAAVVGLHGAAGVEAELGGGEAPGGGAALGQELGDELRERGGAVLDAGARADGGVEGRRVAIVEHLDLPGRAGRRGAGRGHQDQQRGQPGHHGETSLKVNSPGHPVSLLPTVSGGSRQPAGKPVGSCLRRLGFLANPRGLLGLRPMSVTWSSALTCRQAGSSGRTLRCGAAAGRVTRPQGGAAAHQVSWRGPSTPTTPIDGSWLGTSRDLLLLTLGHAEAVKGAAKLGRDLVEYLGGNL